MGHAEDVWNTTIIHQPVQTFVHEFQLLCNDEEWHDWLLWDRHRHETRMHPLTILIPSLYGLHHEKALDDQNCGISWKGGAYLMDLDFSDDIAMLADTKVDLKSMTTNLEREADKIDLRLNSEKMKVMITWEA